MMGLPGAPPVSMVFLENLRRRQYNTQTNVYGEAADASALGSTAERRVPARTSTPTLKNILAGLETIPRLHLTTACKLEAGWLRHVFWEPVLSFKSSPLGANFWIIFRRLNFVPWGIILRPVLVPKTRTWQLLSEASFGFRISVLQL